MAPGCRTPQLRGSPGTGKFLSFVSILNTSAYLSLMNYIFRFLVLLLIPLVASAEQEVIFTAPQDFAVVSTATGRASRSGPFISVVLDRYTMRANTKYRTTQKVVRYKIGLAFTNAKGAWDVARWSEPITQNVILAPGDTKLIENVKTVIPVEGLPSLKSYWLVLAVEIDISGTIGYTYSHSNKELF